MSTPETPEQEKALPCPLCGKEPWGIFGPDGKGCCWVECNTDGCGWFYVEGNREDALKGWNKRADHICPHHTDTERAAITCPVCAVRERDMFQNAMIAVKEIARKYEDRYFSTKAELKELQKSILPNSTCWGCGGPISSGRFCKSCQETSGARLMETLERMRETVTMHDGKEPAPASELRPYDLADHIHDLLKNSIRERDQLQRDLALLKEELAVAKSQVENADVNLEQVRMNAKSQWRSKVESAESKIAELQRDLEAERKKSGELEKRVVEVSSLNPSLVDAIKSLEQAGFGAPGNERLVELKSALRAEHAKELADVAAKLKELEADNRKLFVRAEDAQARAERNTGPALAASKQQAEQLREGLETLLAYSDRNECAHDETHREGFIWTICDRCGRKWADDNGGFIQYEEPKEITQARAALSPTEPGK